ncbi:NFX1-type zinc finger-containing protein 1-like [Diadema setosum]|uniref:NFX1-type zinc finger-containing protein 1-like n=1 Tax=Diadema setosum TaxID=31175 RepID=UPI003B3B722A
MASSRHSQYLKTPDARDASSKKTIPSSEENITHNPLTEQELRQLLGAREKLPVELRARKIPLKQLLDKDDIPKDAFGSLIKVLAMACTSDGEDTAHVFTFVAKCKFLEVHVLQYIMSLRSRDILTECNTVILIAFLMRSFLRYDPSTRRTVLSIAKVLQDIAARKPNINDLRRQLDSLESHLAPQLTKSVSSNRCSLQCFPRSGEVVDCDPLVSVAVQGNHHVLDFIQIQQQLIRQEVVEPLRYQISEYHQLKRNIGVSRAMRECSIFSHVNVYKIITTHTARGVTIRVKFGSRPDDLSGFFTFGTLLCLTSNDFHDMIFASVAKRDESWVQKGFFELRLLREGDAVKILTTRDLTMLDAKIYAAEYHSIYEALEQIRGLQSCMAFQDYMISVSAAAIQKKHHKFLQGNLEARFDPGPLLKADSCAQGVKSTRRVVKLEDWPRLEQCEPDEYQMRAIQSALTKEVTVITGHPGTGKTYVCNKIVHMMVLKERQSHYAPDSDTRQRDLKLFICYSRATLDEFIQGILRFQTTGIIRCGEHTTDADLAKLGLEKQRENHKSEISACDSQYKVELGELGKRLDALRGNSRLLDTAILSVNTLQAVMTEEQRRCFPHAERGEILKWLLFDQIPDQDLRWLQSRAPPPQGRLPGDFWIEQMMSLDFNPDRENPSSPIAKHIAKHHREGKLSAKTPGGHRSLWNLVVRDRWALYHTWVATAQAKIRERIGHIYGQMESIRRKSQKAHDDVDLRVLQTASVVATTCSAAVKIHRVLMQLSPRIVIIEEAGEMLQAVTATIIPPQSQQLVLIGDKYPRINQYTHAKKLAEGNGCETSLLQHLMDSGYPVNTLAMQHRMSPSVSKLSRKLKACDDLKHAASVTKYLPVPGVTECVNFISHNNGSNPANHEASFLWGLFNYLLGSGFQERQISILTTFPAQFNLFRGKLGSQLETVDNFRGENDVILFLSNACERKSMQGRLSSDERLMTVLTAARRALFVIGNFDHLSKESVVWDRVISEARRLDLVHSGLRIVCPRHPKTTSVIASNLENFTQYQKTGCTLPCKSRLTCGHTCRELCHDHRNDARNVCKQQCDKVICINGHRCKERCGDRCQTICQELVEKELLCGHLQLVKCHLPVGNVICQDRCERLLACGHRCSGTCGQPCTDVCLAKTTKSNWPCNHTVEVRCCDGPSVCPWPCGAVLTCGHKCSGTCGRCRRGRLHIPCEQTCGRILVCGHACGERCSPECPPCSKPCENKCQHSHCMYPCGARCVPCRETCLWRCAHISCPKLCGQPCDRKPCNEPCRKLLPCGHPCIGLCGEKCPSKCRVCDEEEVTEIFFGSEDDDDARFVQLEDCGHLFEVNALDAWMQTAGSESASVQLKECPRCKAPIRNNVRYSNQIKRALADIERVKAKMRGNQMEIDGALRKLREKALDLRRQLVLGKSILTERDIDGLLEGDLLQTQLGRAVARRNRCNFLLALHKLYTSASQLRCSHEFLKRERTRVVQELFVLKGGVCGGDLDRFTEQQMHDIQQEMTRLELQIEACQTLGSNVPWLERNLEPKRIVGMFQAIVAKATPFTEEDAEIAEDLLERIKKSTGSAVLGISNSERVEIIKAVGLSKGHWYKCPKGHVYAIGECGGATQRTRCPECGASIGGEQHRLDEGNQVATEMDEARHAAWPTHAHDFEDPGPEFDYLQMDAADVQQQRALEIQMHLLRN